MYKELEIWQESVSLIKDVYKVADLLPKNEEYNLKQQLKRSIVSVALNIAEGKSRKTAKDFSNFLVIANGSLSEVEAILSICEVLGFIQEDKLLREKGVLRYLGDKYYNKNGEAQWTMGLPWLAIIYKKLNMPDKYAFYSRKTLEAMNDKGELPELYYANSNEHNENCPLAWSQAMFVASLKG